MNKHLKVLLLVVLAVSLLSQANGQATSQKTSTKSQAPENPPPAAKKAEDGKRVKVQEEEEMPPPPPTRQELAPDSASLFGNVPKPMVDFDTTAVPDDAFTKDILKMMTVTNALNLGLTFADQMNKEDVENNPMLKEFYTRLMNDMRSGTSRRWLERIYVREYRKIYTPEEIQELLKFYDSPIGRKLVRVTHEMLPGVMSQGKQIGQYIASVLIFQMMKEEEEGK